MKRLVWMLFVALTVGSAAAEDAPPLVLEVRAERVERAELERALGEELRSGASEGAAPPQGKLSLTEGESDLVRLSYRDAAGKTATRELHIARDDPEALEKITLAAANLVRDQSGSLLAELEPAPPSDSETPTPVKLTDLEQPKSTAPYNPCRDGQALRFGGDFVPLLGTSSTRQGRESARNVSLNFGGGYSAGVRGVEVSIGFNIDRRGSCGVQHAVGFNLTLGELRGVQIALANATIGRVRGVQLGLANLARGGANVQLGVGNVSLHHVAGAQVGLGNIAWGDVRGLQVGIGNIARHDATVQVGLVNVSRRAKAPIGLVSIVREGRTTLDTLVSENGTLLSGVTHGGDYVHNFYSVGFRFGPAGTRVGYALGIGVRALALRWLTLDVDSLFEQWSRTDYINSSAMVARLRLTAAFKVSQRLAILAAPGYAIMFTNDPEETTQAPLGSSVIARDVRADSSLHGDIIGFNALTVGLRVTLGDNS